MLNAKSLVTNVLWIVGAAAIAVLVDSDGGTPILSNHVLSDTGAISSNEMSSGIMDLPGPEEQQDANAELNGTIRNNMSSVHKMRDLRMWFEDKDGNKLATPAGEGPVSALDTAPSSQANPTHAATLVSRTDGVSVFNLADAVNQSGFVSYDAQVDHFVEPNNFKIRMAFSELQASTGKHFDILGLATLTREEPDHILDGIAPTVRTGVLIGLRNASSTSDMKGARITLTSNQSTLDFVSGTVLDANNEPVPGSSVSIASEGAMAIVSSLQLSNPNPVNVWLVINEPYIRSTTFTVHGVY